MPTYLYECDQCGRFEQFQRITEEALKECPKCSSAVKRIIGSPGIIFKGSGFYITDSKDKNKKTLNGSTPDDSSKTTPKENSSSDAASGDSSSKGEEKAS